MANDDKTINTGSGASVGNDVQTGGGDFVGRDQITVNINWTRNGLEFITDLNSTIQTEQEKLNQLEKDLQEELEKKAKQDPQPDESTLAKINQLRQALADKSTLAKIDQLRRAVTIFDRFDWFGADQAYRDKVIKLYDRVRILGNSADVPLGNVFTQVYILDKPTARQRHDIEELRKQGWDRLNFQRQLGQRTSGLDLVKTKRNLFILGKPGAGKTTFLKYITIQAAHKELPQIPIFVSLNQWADSKWGKGDKAALLPFIIDQFEICDFPDAELFIDYLLKEGRALVLFDGLDEVKQGKDQRRRLTHLLQDFARKYDKSQYLITCRIAASDYAFADFADVEVADFTADQVREYARKWFGEQEKKFDAFTVELAKPENQGLAELCKTPLLLALLCLTFDNNMRFPPSRAELYEDALETLLRKWDSSRELQRDEIYRTLSHKRKLQLLMSIAVPTFEKGEIFFRQRDLERWIVNYLAKLPGAPPADTLDGTILLKAIEAQHSILVERAQGIYSFSHLTFQEYLTAGYMAENRGSEVTSQLLRKHLADQRWREVFLLTTSLLDNADGFVIMVRTIIDELLKDTASVCHLLAWAYERTKQTNAIAERCRAIQLAYIFLALTIERSLALVLDLALDRAIEFNRLSALILAVELNHTSVRSLERVRDLSLDRALDRVLDLAKETTPAIGFDYGLYYAWAHATIFASEQLDRTNKNWQVTMLQFSNFQHGLAVLADEAGLVSLAQPSPLPSASERDWQHYADALFAILYDKRDLGHRWNFTAREINKLNDYFYANELLVQCLKVAVVSDRQAILNSLLLPPKSE